MDITLFAAVAQIAPFFRDKGFTVMEFVYKFSDSDEDKESDLLDILGDSDLVIPKSVYDTWGFPTRETTYTWK